MKNKPTQSAGKALAVKQQKTIPRAARTESTPARAAKQDTRFYADIAGLLASVRAQTYRVINAVMVGTYWQVGRRIVEQEQKGKNRADYGDRLIAGLSRYLTGTLGKGFSEANIKSMRRFYVCFPQFGRQCLPNLPEAKPRAGQFGRRCLPNLSEVNPDAWQFSRQCLENLSWSNIRTIIRLDNKDERNYYICEAATENWSFRQLDRNIKTGYYRRLLSTQKKGKARKTHAAAVAAMIPDVGDFVKDPYVLEFMNVPEDLSGKETVLEHALIGNMQKFLLELGKGFSFVARQFRVSTEDDHFYADLVFYNYLLKCFVVIDLKTARLAHEDIGQMDMYVRMFDALKRGPDDNPTIGIILCADKSETIVKYSVLKESRQLFASKYKTILPTEEELADMLARENRKLLAAQSELARGKK